MEQLAKVITDTIDSSGLDFSSPLEDAAKKWACYVLEQILENLLYWD